MKFFVLVKSFSIGTALVFMLLSLTSIVYAQDETKSNDSADGSNGAQQTPTMERINEYLKQDIFIQPGVGLKKISIGLPMDDVLRRWGQPQKKDRRGALRLTHEWLYKAGDGTVILVRGKKSVTSIRFVGGLTSNYTTVEGARFGMGSFQVAGIYGTRALDPKKNLMRYPERGLEFAFTHGHLAGIKVSKPKR